MCMCECVCEYTYECVCVSVWVCIWTCMCEYVCVWVCAVDTGKCMLQCSWRTSFRISFSPSSLTSRHHTRVLGLTPQVCAGISISGPYAYAASIFTYSRHFMCFFKNRFGNKNPGLGLAIHHWAKSPISSCVSHYCLWWPTVCKNATQTFAFIFKVKASSLSTDMPLRLSVPPFAVLGITLGALCMIGTYVPLSYPSAPKMSPSVKVPVVVK